jgi:hypothetical protein
MASTHYFVDIGTGGALSTIWAAPTFERLHSVTGNLAGANAWAAGLIGFWSVLVIVGVWSFLVTFFFGGSTAAYFLLRQEVDGYDLEEIYEDDEGDPALVGGEATVASASPAEEKAVETEGDERKDAGDSKKSAVKNKKKKMKKSGERDQG